jgi:uncharacterized protein
MSAPLLVADSGPLIALARVDSLGLPAALFREVLVPSIVWEEVGRRPSPEELERLQAALESGQLRLLPREEPAAVVPHDRRLGAGERSAMAVAVAHGAEILIDERRGRQVAAAAGLQVVGTIGLLVRGRQLGLTGPVRPAIDTLRHSGYHLGESLVERALAILSE